MTINAIIYDCEIIKGIVKKGESRLPDIEYCDGWRDFANMGISVIGAYDYLEDRYRVFCADNFPQFQALLDRANLVIDFNGTQFDKPLLAANNLHFDSDKHYDILREIWKAEGHDPDKFDYRTHGNYGLDACCRANFHGYAKSGNGALAPIDWQRGDIGSVIDYCLNDVRLTKELVDKIRLEGWIINPKYPEDHNQIIHLDF